MINKPWINCIGVLVLLFAIYTAGRSDGRQQAVASMANHPVCQQQLKP